MIFEALFGGKKDASKDEVSTATLERQEMPTGAISGFYLSEPHQKIRVGKRVKKKITLGFFLAIASFTNWRKITKKWSAFPLIVETTICKNAIYEINIKKGGSSNF